MVRHRKAFTLSEVMVVMAIVAVLAGVAAAVAPKVLRSAKQARSLAEIRQIAVAVRLYVDEWGQVPTVRTFGTGSPVRSTWAQRFGVTESLFRGCGFHPNSDLEYSVIYFFITDYLPYDDWIGTYGDQLPVAFDMNCSDPESHPNNPYERRLGLAVSLELSAMRRVAKGSPYRPEFWLDPSSPRERFPRLVGGTGIGGVK